MGIFSKITKPFKSLGKAVTKPFTKTYDVLKKSLDFLPEEYNSLSDLVKLGKEFVPGAVSSAASLAGSKYGYDKQLEGIREQNSSAYRIAQEANAMSQANAREQMAFQNQQTSTAHQREITDLKAAGLNPILSGTGGMGSASGSGAQGSVQTAPVHSEGDAMSSAFQMFKTIAEVLKTNAEKDYLQTAQTQKTQAETKQVTAQTGKISSEIEKIASEIDLNKRRSSLTDAEKDRVDNLSEKLEQEIRYLKSTNQIDDSEYGRAMYAAKKLSSVVADMPIKEILDLLPTKIVTQTLKSGRYTSSQTRKSR